MGGGDDDQGDEDALHKVQAEEVAEHKVEEDLHRLLQYVENDKYEVSHAKKQLVDDEKNTGLLKCKKVALVSSKSNRSSTSFASENTTKLNDQLIIIDSINSPGSNKTSS